MTLYRHGSGAIMLPSWPDSRTIAMAEHHHKTRRVELTWLRGGDACAYLMAASELFLEGEDMTPLTNARHETVGFVTAEHATLRAIPVATPYKPSLAEKRRVFTMSDWRLGADALIQATSIDERGETVCVDDVSGEDAWSKLMQLACDPRAELVGDPAAVYGVAWPDGSREEMWDCDEMTFSSYLENLAEVIQEWESSEGGE